MMVARRAPWTAASLAWLLAACTSGPPPPLQTTTTLAPEAAAERVEQALRTEGFTVERDADTLTARTTGPRFAKCLPVMVGAGDSRRIFTQAAERRAEAVVSFTEAGGQTRVSWQTHFSGRYPNRANNTTFERACDSTGALEDLLVRSVAG
jgi:hypothetical protein